MITQMRLVPVEEGKHPFASAAEKCCFTEIGYVEDTVATVKTSIS